MKKFFVIVISGIVIALGAQLMMISTEISINNFLGFAPDGVLTFLCRSTVGLIGAALVVLATNTAIYQATSLSLIKELEYYVLGSKKEVGDK